MTGIFIHVNSIPILTVEPSVALALPPLVRIMPRHLFTQIHDRLKWSWPGCPSVSLGQSFGYPRLVVCELSFDFVYISNVRLDDGWRLLHFFQYKLFMFGWWSRPLPRGPSFVWTDGQSGRLERDLCRYLRHCEWILAAQLLLVKITLLLLIKRRHLFYHTSLVALLTLSRVAGFIVILTQI